MTNDENIALTQLAFKWKNTANKVDSAHEEWGGACLYVAKSMRQCAAELLEIITEFESKDSLKEQIDKASEPSY